MPGNTQASQRERTATPFGNGDELYFQEASDHVRSFEEIERGVISNAEMPQPNTGEHADTAVIYEIGQVLTPKDALRISGVIMESRERDMDPTQTRFLREPEDAA